MIAIFARLMTSGNVHATSHLISREQVGGSLYLTDVIVDANSPNKTLDDILKGKHLLVQPNSTTSLPPAFDIID